LPESSCSLRLRRTSAAAASASPLAPSLPPNLRRRPPWRDQRRALLVLLLTLLALAALARTGDVSPAVATLEWELGVVGAALNEEFDFPDGNSVARRVLQQGNDGGYIFAESLQGTRLLLAPLDFRQRFQVPSPMQSCNAQSKSQGTTNLDDSRMENQALHADGHGGHGVARALQGHRHASAPPPQRAPPP
jgi:hypothetical protein